MNKKRILENAEVKNNLQKLIEDFEGEESVMRFIYESKKRSAYAQKIDREFYQQVIKVLKKMSDYLILINANKMFHLWSYKNVIKHHEKKIMDLCDGVIKKLEEK